MHKAILTLAAAAAAFVAAPAAAASPASGTEARIPFVNHGGIRNFVAEDRDTLLIEDRRGRWYRADLFGACLDLPYAEAIGFVTRGADVLDKYSSILVRGQRCALRSLVRIASRPASSS